MTDKYECNICGKAFDTEDECLEHIISEEDLSENSEIYMTIHYDVEEEEPSIEEDLDEEPDEDSVIAEETDEELTELLEAVEDYEHLPKEDRDYVLNEVLPSKKKLREDITTGNLIEKLHTHAIEKLLDDTSYVCPWCHKDLEAEAGLDKSELSTTPRFAKFLHLKDAHAYLYQVLKELFIDPKTERRYDDDKPSSAAEEYHLSKEESEE